MTASNARLCLLLGALPVLAPHAVTAQTPDTLVALTTDQISGWMTGRIPVPGVEGLALHGTPAAPAHYVVRTRFQNGAGIGPHFHDRTVAITVLTGVFHIGVGEVENRSVARAYPPGSFLVIPAGTPHFEWGQGETVIQLSGVGPLGHSAIAVDTTRR